MIKKFLALAFCLILGVNLCSCQPDYELYEGSPAAICCDIVYTSVNLSYTYGGDYSKLPDKYKKSVSKEQFSDMNYRSLVTQADDSTYNVDNLGKEIYELNSMTYPKVTNIQGDKVYLEYFICYECRDYKTNETTDGIGGTFDCDVTVTMCKKNDTYVVEDVIEQV